MYFHGYSFRKHAPHWFSCRTMMYAIVTNFIMTNNYEHNNLHFKAPLKGWLWVTSSSFLYDDMKAELWNLIVVICVIKRMIISLKKVDAQSLLCSTLLKPRTRSTIHEIFGMFSVVFSLRTETRSLTIATNILHKCQKAKDRLNLWMSQWQSKRFRDSMSLIVKWNTSHDSNIKMVTS